MAYVAKSLFFVLTLVLALGSSRATPLSASSPLNKEIKEKRFTCDEAVELFQEMLLLRAKTIIEKESSVLGWANGIENVKCIGYNIAQIRFRSYVVMLEPDKKDKTIIHTICMVLEMKVIVGKNPDGSAIVNNINEVQLIEVHPCELKDKDGKTNGGAGGDSQLRK